jgi:hypothetical protein
LSYPGFPAPWPTYLAASGVSCMASGCLVVGNGTHRLFADIWNRKRWSLSYLPKPPRATFGPVSCASTGACTAVGPPPGGTGPAFADHWNGHSWTIQRLPLPAPEAHITVKDISCPSSTDCTTVGSWSVQKEDGWHYDPYIARWLGGRWSIETLTSASPGKVALGGVSCVAQDTCVAVGGSAHQGAVAEQWNGKTWSDDPTSPAVSEGAFNSVSCLSATVCFAVGTSVETTAPARMQP